MIDDPTICPMCLETIVAGARKCKHCGTMLDEPVQALTCCLREPFTRTRRQPKVVATGLLLTGGVLTASGVGAPVGVPLLLAGGWTVFRVWRGLTYLAGFCPRCRYRLHVREGVTSFRCQNPLSCTQVLTIADGHFETWVRRDP